MSLNTCHASQGVLLHASEYILLHCGNIVMHFTEGNEKAFNGIKRGHVFLTSHRIILLNKDPGDLLQSFSAPFIALFQIHVKQPNTLRARVRARPHGNFDGTVVFSIDFPAGGAVEFEWTVKRMLTVIRKKHVHSDLPAYDPPQDWTQVPAAAYERPPGYYEWLAEHPAFSPVPPNVVFMTTTLPTYPGIGAPPAYLPAQDPIPVPTGTPCAKYRMLSNAPAALGYQNEPIGRGCCHNPNYFDKIA